MVALQGLLAIKLTGPIFELMIHTLRFLLTDRNIRCKRYVALQLVHFRFPVTLSGHNGKQECLSVSISCVCICNVCNVRMLSFWGNMNNATYIPNKKFKFTDKFNKLTYHATYCELQLQYRVILWTQMNVSNKLKLKSKGFNNFRVKQKLLNARRYL